MSAAKNRKHKAHRQIINRMAKRQYWRAQDGRCGICGRPIRPAFGSPQLTFDHVWPKSRTAGAFFPDGNYVLAHQACNHAKADRRPTPCEVLLLHAVNRRLGFREHETRTWDALT